MKNLAAALVKAQSELPAVHKNATAKVKTKTGADFSYSYVTLDALLGAVLPTLNSNGIALIQAPTLSVESGGMVLKTVLAHGDSGETFEAQAPLKTAGTPQEIGSEISYARRYAIMSLLGIAADEDDDAQAASKSKPKKATAREAVTAALESPPNQATLRDIDSLVTEVGHLRKVDRATVLHAIDESIPDWRTSDTAGLMAKARLKAWREKAEAA